MSRSGHRSGTARRVRPASRGRPRHRPGTRSTTWSWDGPLPRSCSMMLVSSRGPRRRRPWWCHPCSSTPSTRTPAKRDGPSTAAVSTGWMWDHTVFHVLPAGGPGRRWWLLRNAADADRPGAQQRARGAHRPVLLGEGHRFAGVLQAHPAVHTTGSAPAPLPRARRSPPRPPARALVRSPRTQDTRQPGRTTRSPGPSPCRTARLRSGGNPPYPTHPHPTLKSQ